jgi:hypothetical protein
LQTVHGLADPSWAAAAQVLPLRPRAQLLGLLAAARWLR